MHNKIFGMKEINAYFDRLENLYQTHVAIPDDLPVCRVEVS